MHIENFLNYWYGNRSPSNFTALLYTLDMEEKGTLHIKAILYPWFVQASPCPTLEFGNNFVRRILFGGCSVCRLFDVQYFREWIQVSKSIICTMPWCATVCLVIWKKKNTISYCEAPKGLIWCKLNHFIVSILPHWIKTDVSIDTSELIYFPQRKCGILHLSVHFMNLLWKFRSTY